MVMRWHPWFPWQTPFRIATFDNDTHSKIGNVRETLRGISRRWTGQETRMSRMKVRLGLVLVFYTDSPIRSRKYLPD
jgi:hypothetical protein